CGLSVNTLKQMTDKNGMASFSLAKIADELDCSVDYLLGRTDNPQAHKASPTAVSVGDVSNNSGIISGIGNNAPVSINNSSAALNPQQAALLEVFDTLSPMQQAKLMVYTDSLRGKGDRTNEE
ncbi:MAG: hypothetical protein NC452_15755, partial [Eubacterium sp.]|nr:hypothetical protein [Eubacterium sp.]